MQYESMKVHWQVQLKPTLERLTLDFGSLVVLPRVPRLPYPSFIRTRTNA